MLQSSKEVLSSLQDYEFDELNEITEMIKYSDPVSTKEVEEIETEFKKEISIINKDNLNETIKYLKKLIKKRNTIIKNNK